MNSCAKLFILIAIAGVCVILYLATLEGHFTADLNCGKRPERPSTMMPSDYDDNGGGRFVGGTPIDPSIWPWQVSIMHRPTAADPLQHHCGGVIISQDWILTAAICVHAPQHRHSSNLVVKAGTTDANHNDANTQELQIERIVRHKRFNPITLRYNIALLKLKPSLVFNTFVDGICIPDDSNVEEHHYSICHITGYAGPNANTSILQEAEVKEIGNPRCNMPTWQNYKMNLGGPVSCFMPAKNRYYVYGVRVYTKDCGVPRQPNIYLRVSKHFYWIQRELGNSAPPSLLHFTLWPFLCFLLSSIAKIVI
ncbi:unnamed protein product [Coregonus sp. 'balchen']|nr:unnamed protein product [Coregonus sp. 'balchen']